MSKGQGIIKYGNEILNDTFIPFATGPHAGKKVVKIINSSGKVLTLFEFIDINLNGKLEYTEDVFNTTKIIAWTDILGASVKGISGKYILHIEASNPFHAGSADVTITLNNGTVTDTEDDLYVGNSGSYTSTDTRGVVMYSDRYVTYHYFKVDSLAKETT